MKDFLLSDVDDEDAGDVLAQVEQSFDVKFGEDELINVSSIRDIYDVILNKFNSNEADLCTLQKAFYTLRKELKNLNIYQDKLLPETATNVVFKKDRRVSIKRLENTTGYKLNILRPSHFNTILNIIILLSGLINWIFFDTWSGVGLSALSVFSFWISAKLGSVLKFDSIREVVKHVTSTNYSKVRGDEKINPKELSEILIDFFHDMGLTERPSLDSKFGWAEK